MQGLVEPLVVFVLGPTASGKSAVALRIAASLGGEIVNADAMQLYVGAPVATNKATEDEQRQVRHHLLGTQDPKQPLTVRDFVALASAAIADIGARGRVALVVGGTSYYALSLLFRDRLLEAGEANVAGLSLAEKRALLERHDPAAALRIDPKDERKTSRALQVFLSSGKTQTELHAQQDRHRLRYGNCRVVRVERGGLEETIRVRVDEMMRRGLEKEARDFCAAWGEEPIDCELGIWQAIGLKEFLDQEATTDAIVERIKVATIRYAKKQQKMLRNSVCPLLDHAVVDSQSGDTMEPLCEWLRWGTDQPGVPIVRATRTGLAEPPALLECCEKTMLGAAAIQQHLKSKGHKARKRRMKDENCEWGGVVSGRRRCRTRRPSSRRTASGGAATRRRRRRSARRRKRRRRRPSLPHQRRSMVGRGSWSPRHAFSLFFPREQAKRCASTRGEATSSAARAVCARAPRWSLPTPSQ
jgi:tRNA dimethylallyltransferase